MAEKSVFKRGAEKGVLMGCWLTIIALMTVYTDLVPILSVLALTMIVITPVFVYKIQRRDYVTLGGAPQHAEEWMLGILLFLFGLLISSLVMYCVLTWLRPDYIQSQAKLLIDTLTTTPELFDDSVREVLVKAVDEDVLPTPIDVVYNMFWFVGFIGAIMSALTAIFAVNKRLPNKR